MKIIYLIIGRSGNKFEIRWPVKAFTSLDAARDYLELAQQEANTLQIKKQQNYFKDIPYDNPYDPNMVMQLSGVFYHYEAVELIE